MAEIDPLPPGVTGKIWANMAQNINFTDAAAVTTTNVKAIIDALESGLAENPAGPVSISIDGVSTTYNRPAAIQELEYWRKRYALEQGTRSRSSRIKLNG